MSSFVDLTLSEEPSQKRKRGLAVEEPRFMQGEDLIQILAEVEKR